MDIDYREMADVLERFWIKHTKNLQDEGKMSRDEDELMEITPTDMDYREYAEEIIKDINKIKGKWII